MEPLRAMLSRFMRLLPFLTTPNSYRRFHYELLFPYPDVWAPGEQEPAASKQRKGRGYLAEWRRHPGLGPEPFW